MGKITKLFKRNKLITYSVIAVIMVGLIVTISLIAKSPSEATVPANATNLEFVMPISNATISKSFNGDELQYNKTLNVWEIHKGLDLVATTGANVLACYDGKVTSIDSNYLEGTTIEITHGDGLVSIYQGLANETKVKVGDIVTTNQIIGTVASGSQEAEDGSHIHFELIKDGEKIDPLSYIKVGLKD